MRLFFATSVLLAVTACGSVSTSPPDAPPTCTPACGAHATCAGTTCVCDDGYAMNTAGLCGDIDECATANGGCAADAVCTNTDGARTCACADGFLGDGLTCRPVWSLEATLPFDIDPSQFGSAMVAHNDLVYIGVETNTQSAKAFRSYNTTTRQVSGPPPSELPAVGLKALGISFALGAEDVRAREREAGEADGARPARPRRSRRATRT